MIWTQHGLIFRPDTSRPWMRSHAAAPVAILLGASLCRVFFNSRDENNRTHVGWFDIDLHNPGKVLDTSPDPILWPGPTGHFDGDGIYALSAARTDTGALRLYTAGWTRGAAGPLFYAAIGMADSDDDGRTITHRSVSPILGRSDIDPVLVTAPFVLRDMTGWRMWYVSGSAWTEEENGLQSHYAIKSASSVDGLNWRPDGRIAIPTLGGETNIGRCCVIETAGRHHAWFSASVAGMGYRMRHATSADGLEWTRDDLEGPGGADAVVAYPYVLEHEGVWHMFYSGPGFGREGVYLACAKAPEG